MMEQKRILVVDDDAMTRDLIAFSLREKGYEVTAEADGLHAVIRLREKKPDLVILDVMLPDLSGFELLNMIRIDLKMTAIPVILISRLASQKVINNAHKFGATSYMVKPFTTDQMLNKIASLPGFEFATPHL